MSAFLLYSFIFNRSFYFAMHWLHPAASIELIPQSKCLHRCRLILLTHGLCLLLQIYISTNFWIKGDKEKGEITLNLYFSIFEFWYRVETVLLNVQISKVKLNFISIFCFKVPRYIFIVLCCNSWTKQIVESVVNLFPAQLFSTLSLFQVRTPQWRYITLCNGQHDILYLQVHF